MNAVAVLLKSSTYWYRQRDLPSRGSMVSLEVAPTAKFTVLSSSSVVSKDETTSFRRCRSPITDVTHLVDAGELHALGLYLLEKLPSISNITDFDAAGRKHADSIVLQDLTSYGGGPDDDDDDDGNSEAATVGVPVEDDFRECRTHRGSPEFWRHNANAAQLPGLVSFVDRALQPFFQSTGKVTIILSPKSAVGVEHVDHKFNDWVSEFVWLRTGVGAGKPLYVRDANGDKRYVNDHDNSRKSSDGVSTSSSSSACCIWFDDHHAHSFDTIDEACYSVRVDGCFTEEFRKHLCQVGTFWNGNQQGSSGGLRDVLQAQGGTQPPLSAAALQSQTTAIATAHAACDMSQATMLQHELDEARRQIARLEVALKDKEHRHAAVESSRSPPHVGPPRGLTEDSLFCGEWAKATRPLYELQMGTENMAPLLYSIIRFHKPVKVLEVGAGFTTIFALQALHDNDAEIDMYQQLCRDESFAWPKLNWLNEGYLNRSGGYRHSQLYCVDNMAHTGTTARLVSTVAASLGLEERLIFIEGDATGTATRNELEEELGDGRGAGLLWIDFGDGDRLDEVLLDHGYWDLVDPNGGLVLVHSTLTNAASREWLSRMKQHCTSSSSASDNSHSSRYGQFELLSLMEPHKMRQNSVTMLRRMGNSVQDPFVEPIFTQYA
jgi:Methyltransferase domain